MDYKDVFKETASHYDLSEEEKQKIWESVQSLGCPWNRQRVYAMTHHYCAEYKGGRLDI